MFKIISPLYFLSTLLISMVFINFELLASSEIHEDKLLLISAGEVTGYYYPVAGAICRIINKDKPDGFSCAVVPSSGSTANLAALKAGEVDMSIVQARAGFLSVTGFQNIPHLPNIRNLMGLHGETIALVVVAGSKIETLEDIKGKRINIGRSGSFQRLMTDMVLEAAGLSLTDILPLEMTSQEQTNELCNGDLDAAVFVGVHPIDNLVRAMKNCNVTLLPVDGERIEDILGENPWLSRVNINADTYDEQANDIATLQVRAFLATTKDMPEKTAKLIFDEIQKNIVFFSRLHPVLYGLVGNDDTTSARIPIIWHEGIGEKGSVTTSSSGFIPMISAPLPSSSR